MVRGDDGRDLRRHTHGPAPRGRAPARGRRTPDRPARARATGAVVIRDSRGPSPISSEDGGDDVPLSQVIGKNNWTKTRARDQHVGASSRRYRRSRSPSPVLSPGDQRGRKRFRSSETVARASAPCVPPPKQGDVQSSSNLVRGERSAPMRGDARTAGDDAILPPEVFAALNPFLHIQLLTPLLLLHGVLLFW